MLKINNLSKYFFIKKHLYLKKEKIIIFENLNLHLKNTNLLIQGKSGSGKSTLAKIICKLLKVNNGEIYFNNENIKNIKDEIFKRQIQYVFQDQKLALNPYKTIKNLIFDVYDNFNIKKDYEKVLYFFDLFDLKEDILKLKPFELSVGQAQRIGLIRALIIKPKLLILDEITSSLDILNSIAILNFLKKFQKENEIFYIFITHQKEFFKSFEFDEFYLNY